MKETLIFPYFSLQFGPAFSILRCQFHTAVANFASSCILGLPAEVSDVHGNAFGHRWKSLWISLGRPASAALNAAAANPLFYCSLVARTFFGGTIQSFESGWWGKNKVCIKKCIQLSFCTSVSILHRRSLLSLPLTFLAFYFATFAFLLSLLSLSRIYILLFLLRLPFFLSLYTFLESKLFFFFYLYI